MQNKELIEYIRSIIPEVIEKSGNKWIVKSKSGKTLGTHTTKRQAVKQLAAIEINKQ